MVKAINMKPITATIGKCSNLVYAPPNKAPIMVIVE